MGPADHLPLLLTIPQAAAELGVHRDTVYELIAAKQLAAVNIAVRLNTKTKLRVRPQDLVAFIESRVQPAESSLAASRYLHNHPRRQR
jgi:excisionase family DNA binding protein